MGIIDYIDVKRAAVEVLRDWNTQRFKLEHEAQQLARLRDRMYATGSSTVHTVPTKTRSGAKDVGLCDTLDKKQVAEQALRCAQEYDRAVSPCWAQLNDQDRYCLTARYIDHEEGDGIARIMKHFNIERSEAYRRSDAALLRFTKLLFW